MTDKEALKIVDECIEEGKIVQEAFNYSFLYTVQKALKKQIPKEPLKFNEKLYLCPNCHGAEYIRHRDALDTYCGFCGQAIDWSEVKNEIENND